MVNKTFSLDGRTVPFQPGQSILDAARDNGTHIPTLCFLKGVAPSGACRICLVEVKGARTLMASCSTPVTPDMEALTNIPRIHTARKLSVELLLSRAVTIACCVNQTETAVCRNWPISTRSTGAASPKKTISFPPTI